MLAQREQGSAFRLNFWWQAFPFRSANRTEEDGIRLFRGFNGFRWQRVASGIDGGTADELFAAFDAEAELGFDGVENANGFGHDFGANAVAGEDRDAVLA